MFENNKRFPVIALAALASLLVLLCIVSAVASSGKSKDLPTAIITTVSTSSEQTSSQVTTENGNGANGGGSDNSKEDNGNNNNENNGDPVTLVTTTKSIVTDEGGSDPSTVTDPPSVITTSPVTDTVVTTRAPETTTVTTTPEIVLTTLYTTAPAYNAPDIDPDKVGTVTVSTNALEEELDVRYTATSLLAYELGSDTLIFTTDMAKRIYPASTTKIITALYALYVAEPDDVFTVGDELDFVAKDASVAKLKKGQRISLEHLLYAMMLPSGNDAAYTVAANIGRILAEDKSLSAKASVDLFMEGMNKYADHIGMTDTNFTCPDGYHDENHYSTLHDMLVATVAACGNKTLMQVASTPYIKVKVESGASFEWGNSNYLLGSEKYPDFYYEGAVGLKTGYTSAAGACLISVVERNGKTVALLFFDGDNKIERYSESISVLDCVFEYLEASEADQAA